MPRPDALGPVITIDSLDTVDQVLAELSWLNAENARRKSICSQKVESVVSDHVALAVVEIDGESISLADRIETLTDTLELWITTHGEEHFVKDARSLKLPHGTVGLRQNPMSLDLAENVKSDDAVAKVDKRVEGLIKKSIGFVTAAVKSLGCKLSDLVNVKVSLNMSGIKKLFTEKKITEAKLKTLGVVVNKAFDKPVIEPIEMTISAE